MSVENAIAGKPSWAGNGKDKHEKVEEHGKKHKKERKAKKRNHKAKDGNHKKAKKSKRYFGAEDRKTVRTYYKKRYVNGGKCPPGLAKKNNGCLPPGQAKKRWRYNHRLKDDVVVYDLPKRLVVKLPIPPPDSKYIRVAEDILLIAIGTKIVLDAIEDLGRI